MIPKPARAVDFHPRIDTEDPTRIRLADAQLVIAREHGFASWPRLVRYVGDVERQQHGHTQLQFGPDAYKWEARRLLAYHHARRPFAARSLAAYVPRFYGMSIDEVFASTVTEEEARLAVARGHGAPSWEVLVERLVHNARTEPGEWESDPIRASGEALAAADRSALERVVAAHPELLQASELNISAGRTLMASALWQEREQGAAAMKPIMDWLASRGLDRQLELNRRLCGNGIGRPTAEQVRALIDQGADPNWVAPNGIPVLEHALAALLESRGGGRAGGVREAARRALDRRRARRRGRRTRLPGRPRKPTAAARWLRPDFVAVGRRGFGPQLPDADDEEILVEALIAAILNGRTAVIEYLASRGAPLNNLVHGPIVIWAINLSRADVLECLVRCGADLDIQSDSPNGTPRELVRTLFEQSTNDPWRRRLVEACGMDPDALLAEIDARPVRPPELRPTVQVAIALASDDAARLGQPDVRPENLLFGLLRAGKRPLGFLKSSGRMDVEQFHADLADRLAPAERGANPSELPMHADAQAVIDAAISTAAAQRQEIVDEFHLMHALTARHEDPVAELLARYGISIEKLHADLGSWLML